MSMAIGSSLNPLRDTTQDDGDWIVVRHQRPSSRPHSDAFVHEVRRAYDALVPDSKKQRTQAANVDMRSAFNFVKGVLYDRIVRPGDAGLDLGCGCGHDVYKWGYGRPRCVLFADVSATALAEADRRWRRAKGLFAASFCELDFTRPEAVGLLRAAHMCRPNDAAGERAPPRFSVVSCHNALQYAPARKGGIDAALALASACLVDGGIFFGTLPDSDAIRHSLVNGGGGAESAGASRRFGHFTIRFAPAARVETGYPYEFDADDGVRCRQYVVEFGDLVEAARRHGLELQFEQNCAQWYDAEARNAANATLLQRFRVPEALDGESSAALRMYRIFVFRRKM